MTKPFFTITTPTYNRAHTLERVFDSLNEQTFQNFEWIIGDDGSTDNTEELVNNFFVKNQWVIIKKSYTIFA